MSGAGLWQFLVVCVELLLIGALIFVGIDQVISADEKFKRIAKYAVGGALLLYFLVAVGGVLFGGGGAKGLQATPIGLLQLGIAIIVLFLVIYIIELVVNAFAPEPAKAVIVMVVGAVAIIVMMLVAANVLGGGTLVPGHFQLR
jgi:hypothetical protein